MRRPPARWTFIQATGAGGLASAGVTDELLDPMPHCVDTADPFAEYGIIEYRLSRKYPDLYAAHIHDRGHVMLAPSRVTASNCGIYDGPWRELCGPGCSGRDD